MDSIVVQAGSATPVTVHVDELSVFVMVYSLYVVVGVCPLVRMLPNAEILETWDSRATTSLLAVVFKHRSSRVCTPFSRTSMSGKSGFSIAYVHIHV